jgi:hypothetical protein
LRILLIAMITSMALFMAFKAWQVI